jgi:predicted site-specific integrase-resolvase
MWLRPQAYASKYGISLRCVYNWARRGKIQSKRVGHTRFVLDGEAEKTQLDRIEQKIDALAHEHRKANQQ